MDEFRDQKVVFALAEAFVEWARKERGDGGAALRRLAGEATASDSLVENTRRDELEMVLLAASKFGDVEATSVKLVLTRILRSGDPSVRSFARRYQDAILDALASRGGEDNKNLVRWVLATKTGKNDFNPVDVDEPTVVIHAWDSKGVAILLRSDAEPVVSRFEQGLSHWRAAGKPEPIAAPWDKTMTEALAAIKGNVLIYWSDPVRELVDEDYPFVSPPRDRCMFLPLATPGAKPSK